VSGLRGCAVVGLLKANRPIGVRPHACGKARDVDPTGCSGRPGSPSPPPTRVRITQLVARPADNASMLYTDPYLCHLFVLSLTRLPAAKLRVLLDEPPSLYGPRVRA
jgi:hypothetical protein